VFESVGLVARFDKKNAVKLAGDLTKHLRTKGLSVYVEDTLAERMNIRQGTVALGNMKTDFIITIGGDGTILRTCVSIPKPEPPILAVNMGVRGFLTEVNPGQALAAVDKCLAGEFEIEKCMKLAISANGTKFPEALNEVVVSADEPAKLLYSRILRDGEPIINCQSDGLMVATQTGSTGYSLSAGGPVLDPSVDAFVLTPICPLSVFHPIVFPGDSALTVEVNKPKKTRVLIDGHSCQVTSCRHPGLTVTRSKNRTSFIRFRENFYHRLRSRLLFRGMKWETLRTSEAREQ
jgi:NAD+ kinase